jgi:hypothetical protein
MQTTSTELFRISQGHLNLLAACPRKFQHTYLEKITTPNNPGNEEHQINGSRFHLLIQQQEMGLPIHSLLNTLKTDDPLKTWINDFNKNAPEILNPEPEKQIFRESEHYRTLQIQDYLITVIYDLLILEPDQAKIFDWKTYRKPLKKEDLVKNWQTRLYMYVLAETSDYLPENISMTYWFVQSQNKHKNITINYTKKQHIQTRDKINQLLSYLTNCLDMYQNGKPFPQVEEYQTCHDCQFAQKCNRFSELSYSKESSDANIINYVPNLDMIEEVPLWEETE